MIKFSTEFFRKTFSGDDMKTAYISAVKWYSTNVLSKVEFANVHVQFEKTTKGEFPAVTIHLFAVQDSEKDVMEQHCKCCKEMHSSFFINEDTHCGRCSALGFQNRLVQRIVNKKQYYKEMLRKQVEGK